MAIAYRMTSDSLIEQQDADGVFRVHVLEDNDHKFGREKTLYDKQVERWHSLAADNELRVGVPAALTKAFIFSESGGKPDAHGPQSDYGIGLMMITHNSLKQGLSNEEVFIPENNVRLGTDFLRTLAAKAGSYDPVQISSMYNCGPGAKGAKVSPDAPWGVCEYHTPEGVYTGYISKIVRSYNYGVLKDGASSGAGSSFFRNLVKVVLGIGVLAGVAAAGVALADPDLIMKAKKTVLP